MSAWLLAVVAGVVLVYALLSRRLAATPISAAIFFLSAGLLFGSKGSAGSTSRREARPSGCLQS